MFNFIAYLKLRNKKWERMSVGSRIGVFQKMENIEAKRHSRKPMIVECKKLESGLQGLCDINAGKIFLTEEIFNKKYMQFFGLAVLFHEGRHAFQQEEVNENKKPSVFSKIHKWQKNLEGYVHYEKAGKYSYYSMQDVERDANKYALKRLKKLHFWLKNEEGYLETVELKQKELQDQKETARKELGLFYNLKVKLRNKRERDR